MMVGKMEQRENGGVPFLVFPALRKLVFVRDAFSTRLGGVSTGTQASLNLAFGRGDTMENVETNIRLLASNLGFAPEKLVLTRQTHSDIVRAVTMDDCRGLCHRDYPECDALVTNTPGISLMVFTADCTPLLLWDPVTGAVGAAHAGWRGTAQDIAGKTVQAMQEHFGARPEDIRSAVGPNIGPCHFETNADVPEALCAAFGRDAEMYIQTRGDKFFPDLKAINAMALRRRGVTRIEVSTDCTCCSTDRFWSHRATAGERGSQGAVIMCRGVCR